MARIPAFPCAEKTFASAAGCLIFVSMILFLKVGVAVGFGLVILALL
jgi:hypothetical protein